MSAEYIHGQKKKTVPLKHKTSVQISIVTYISETTYKTINQLKVYAHCGQGQIYHCDKKTISSDMLIVQFIFPVSFKSTYMTCREGSNQQRGSYPIYFILFSFLTFSFYTPVC